MTSALAERLDGGRYIDIAIDRVKAARYGVSVKELQSIVASVVGGDNIGETIEGENVTRSASATRAKCATRCKSCAICR